MDLFIADAWNRLNMVIQKATQIHKLQAIELHHIMYLVLPFSFYSLILQHYQKHYQNVCVNSMPFDGTDNFYHVCRVMVGTVHCI